MRWAFICACLMGCGGAQPFTFETDGGVGFSDEDAGDVREAPEASDGGLEDGTDSRPFSGSGGTSGGSGGAPSASGGRATGGALSTGGMGSGTGGSLSTGGVASDGCVETTHDNGLGQTWTDCVPKGTHNLDQALRACEAYTGECGPCTSMADGCGGPREFVFCVHPEGNGLSSVYQWTYSGALVGGVSTQSCAPTSEWN